MSASFIVHKEVIVKEDGRLVILYSFERVTVSDKSQPQQESASP